MHLSVCSLFLDTAFLPDSFCAFVSFGYPDSTSFTSQGLVCQSKSCGSLKATPHSVLWHRQMPVSSTCTGQWHSTIQQVGVSSGTKEMQLQPHILLNCPWRCINTTPGSGHGSDIASFSRGKGICACHTV